MVPFLETCENLRMRPSVSILIPYRKADITQMPRNEAPRGVRKEAECEESDLESTDPTDNKFATQKGDDTSYVNLNPTQLPYVDNDTRLSNVHIESSAEATDPTDLNKATITQVADDTSHDSYVNMNLTELCPPKVDDARPSNVYIESGTEATDPTYMNINATATQRAATTTHTSYVNVNIAQFSEMEK